MSIVEILPKVEPQPDIVYTKLKYYIQAVYPNVKAVISAFLYTEDFTQNKNISLELTQPEYSEWGTDDSFILDWVLQQVGAELKPTVVVSEATFRQTPLEPVVSEATVGQPPLEPVVSEAAVGQTPLEPVVEAVVSEATVGQTPLEPVVEEIKSTDISDA